MHRTFCYRSFEQPWLGDAQFAAATFVETIHVGSLKVDKEEFLRHMRGSADGETAPLESCLGASADPPAAASSPPQLQPQSAPAASAAGASASGPGPGKLPEPDVGAGGAPRGGEGFGRPPPSPAQSFLGPASAAAAVTTSDFRTQPVSPSFGPSGADWGMGCFRMWIFI